MLSFIGLNEIFGMCEMGKGFSGIFQQGVAFLLNMELLAGGRASIGDDGFHSIFFFSVDNERRR